MATRAAERPEKCTQGGLHACCFDILQPRRDQAVTRLRLPAPPPPRCAPPQGDVTACSGEVLAAGDARAHQQALELLQWR